MLRRTVLLVALVAGSLVIPAPAGAVVTTTTVTSPSDHSFLYFNVADVTTGTISGTASGAADGDTVVVTCTYPASPTGSLNKTVATTTVAGGVWSTGPVTRFEMSGRSCDLRAVPAGPVPTGPALVPFAPVRVSTLSDERTVQSGHLIDFLVKAGLDGGYADFDSLGGCGLADMQVFGASGATRTAGDSLYYCNDWVYNQRITPPGEAARWMATVDGARALNPSDANHALPGAPTLLYSAGTSAAGVVTITESDPIVTCATLVSPADPLSACATYAPTGITFERMMTTGDTGRTVRIVDTWRSTDAAPHVVDYWTEETYNSNTAGSRSVRLPGDAGYAVRAAGEVYPIAPGADTVYTRSRSDVPDDSVEFPQGAMTWDVAPDKVFFVDSRDSYYHHAVAVPAGGGTTLARQYAMSDTMAQLTGFADPLAKPKVAITAPLAGAALTSTSVVVTGTATDNVGVTSVTVDGKATPVTGGAFSAPVALTLGSNTITVVAKDAAGNETIATVTVTYALPIVVPPIVIPPVVIPPLQKLFTGTQGKDTLVGNAADNVLDGLAGDDRLSCGAGGKDVASGGPGNDVINCVEPLASAKANRDTVNCGPGIKDVAIVDPFDTVIGCEFVTRVWNGGATADSFKGTKANDRFDGKGGNDKVTCGGGVDSVLGGAGNDTINCADAGSKAARKKSHDVVNCGAGTKDVATVDKFDKVVGCERVIRK